MSGINGLLVPNNYRLYAKVITADVFAEAAAITNLSVTGAILAEHIVADTVTANQFIGPMAPAGWQSGADAVDKVRIGDSAVAADANQVALLGSATGTETVAVGAFSSASLNQGIAIGRSATSSGFQSIAIGGITTSSATNSFAAGYLANAVQTNGISLGNQAAVTGLHSNSLAIGTSASCTSSSCVALGREANASVVNSTAIGRQSIASGVSSFAAGYLAVASNLNTIAIGREAIASGTNSIAIGNGAANTSGNDSIAIGNGAIANTNGKVCIGNGCTHGLGSISIFTTQNHRVINNSLQTTTAANTNLCIYSMGTGGTGKTAIGSYYVSAYESATGDYKMWSVTGVSGLKPAAAQLVGSIGTTNVLSSTAGAAAWTITSILNATSSMVVQVNGEVGKTINWVGVMDLYTVDHTTN